MTGLILPRDQRAQIESEASAAFPRECCGLLEGARIGSTTVVTRIHPTRNLAGTPNAFEIDPAEHIRLLRELRATGKEIVGCYHSHPEGRPEPSARDRDGAGQTGYLWLIAALTAPGCAAIKAFRFDGNDFQPVPITATASLDPARHPRV